MTTQEALMFFSMMVMVLASTVLFYWMKRMTIGAFAALGWFFWGPFTYNLAGGPGVLYELMGTFFIIIGMFVAWEVWTDINVERKAEEEETRAEDLDDLKDRLDNAKDNFNDKEANRLQAQIDRLEAKGNPTINMNLSEKVRRRIEERSMREFEQTGTYKKRR